VAQITKTVVDMDGRERIVVINNDKGLPKTIIRTPKKITTNRKAKKGSKGKPMNLNGKDYGIVRTPRSKTAKIG